MKAKKLLSVLLVTVMCIVFLPQSVWAENSTSDVSFTALDGLDTNTGEGYSKAFDNVSNTKWCVSTDTTTKPYVVFKSSDEVVIVGYSFTTANDNAKYTGRKPTAWTLYGCNDYNTSTKIGTWNVIDSVTNDTVIEDKNYTKYDFSCTNNEVYQYYKFEFTEFSQSEHNLIQFSEIDLDWTMVYNVEYNLNYENSESVSKKSNEELPTPERNGYDFCGWWTKDGTDNDWGEAFKSGTIVYYDITVYAKWQKIYYVTFNINDGSNEIIGVTEHGRDFPEINPENGDFKFGGWWTKDGANGDWGENYTQSMTLTSDITVYAKWNTINVTFDKNGGTTDAIPNITGKGEKLPSINPTYTGFKFCGWWTKDGSDGDYGTAFSQNISSTLEDDIIVYAKWEPISVTFDQNGGETEGYPQSFSYGTLPEENPERNGFAFDGWWTENGTNGTYGEQYVGDLNFTDDTTVYAKWKISGFDCSKNVVFSAISGTKSSSSSEEYSNLVDGMYMPGNGNWTKWSVNDFTDAYVILEASQYSVVTSYKLTTGNDNASHPGRNPKDWTLYGSNDYDSTNQTGTWNVIHTVTDDTLMEDKNYRTYTYDTENTNAYKYYKLDITAIQSGDFMQLCELQFVCKGCEHYYGTPVHTDATCVTSAKDEYTCPFCGISAVITVGDPLGHTPGTDQKCSVCKKAYGVIMGTTIYNTLQDAIDASAENDVAVLNDDMEITRGLTIRNNKNLTIDLNGHNITNVGEYAIFYVDGILTLKDTSEEKTSIMTGNSVGISIGSSGTLNYEGGTLTGCKYTMGAGIDNWGTLNFKGGTISDCSVTTSTGTGGGIRNIGTMTISGGTIENCTAYEGGGIYNASSKTVDITGGTIKNCTATRYGGGLYSSGPVNFYGGTISGCKTTDTIYGQGGGIYSMRDGVNVDGGTILDCHAKISGGGIYGYLSDIKMISGTISECSARVGGGIAVWQKFEMTGGEIKNNKAIQSGYGNGGGVALINYSSMTLTAGTITKNSSVDNGGGISVAENAQLVINGGVVSENTAEYGGGIICQDSGAKLTINGGEIKNNSASKYGGGVITSRGNTVDMTAGIIYGNTSKKGGGGIAITAGSSLNMSGGTLKENQSTNSASGGGVYLSSSSTFNMTDGEIKNNISSKNGGGIASFLKSNVNISQNATITGNTANSNGGGVYLEDESKIVANGGKISGNKADEKGAGVGVYGSTAEFGSGIEISKNGELLKNCNGGGMYIENSTFILNDTVIKENTGILGGGIYVIASSVTINTAEIENNNASCGGGIYVDEDVMITLNGGVVKENTAVEKAGGIYCDTDKLYVDGAVKIVLNKSGSEALKKDSNLYLANGNTINILSVSVVSDDEEKNVENSEIGVTLQNGSGNVVSQNTVDYSGYLKSDLENYGFYYENDIVKLYEICMITFVFGEDDNRTLQVKKNSVVSNDIVEDYSHSIEKSGCVFGGWFEDNMGYDFSKPITKNVTLIPKWLEKNKAGISMTPEKIYVSAVENAVLYVASYKDKVLKSVVTPDVDSYMVFAISDLDIDTSSVDEVKVFLWDNNFVPLCENKSVIFSDTSIE